MTVLAKGLCLIVAGRAFEKMCLEQVTTPGTVSDLMQRGQRHVVWGGKAKVCRRHGGR
jgi:hypothetical protein